MTISLPLPMWDFNTELTTNLVESEMLSPEVSAIQVFDLKSNLFASASRDKKGRIVSVVDLDKVEGIPIEADLYHQLADHSAEPALPQNKIGSVVIYFTRHRIDELLRSNALHSIFEILVIDALLIFTLRFSLRLVFTPLGQLRDALMELAEHGGEDVEELPETQKNEIGEVIQCFNQTQRKFKHVIEHLRQAEEATRAEAVKADLAYVALKAAQETMLQTEKLASLGGMVAGVAHEINTPVGITLTSASVLKEATDHLNKAMADGAMKKSEIVAYTTTAGECARLIMKNAERASHLINSFKQVASDQTSEQRREYELSAYIDEVMSSLRPTLRLNQVQVNVNCPTPIAIDGFPGAMAQVLTNLTMNAITHAFTERGQGVINITANQVGETVNLTFADNGVGIPQANIGKIFDLFFTTQRATGGTGLGLNIVHNILYKQFGGSISVSSEAGKGSCFFMHFPRVIA
ncbi:sensor histidine kinase [Solimicrobium silvestre]|uniref:sensor histidine kinase n=1 Tax=Solimicrobium silvestre TaxID=2099400 RepID=UPI0013FE0715|nr:HAMP domain-containing sensor histidine kinase [Solimicrobium silvestre]